MSSFFACFFVCQYPVLLLILAVSPELSDITDLRLCGLAWLLGMAALGMALVSGVRRAN